VIPGNEITVGGPEAEDCLSEGYSDHWAAMVAMRHLKSSLDRPLDKVSGSLLALNRKQYRLVTWLLTVLCTLRLRPHVTGFSESIACRERGREDEFSYCIVCQCPALASPRTEICSCAWLGLIDAGRAPGRMVLAVALRSELCEGLQQDQGTQ
jgi:hypothetical protein